MAENEQIDFDTLNSTYIALKSVHKAANNANDELVKKNNELMNENLQLKGQLVSIEQNLLIQKTIVTNNITGSAERQQRDYEEVENLRNQIKKLKVELENDK